MTKKRTKKTKPKFKNKYLLLEPQILSTTYYIGYGDWESSKKYFTDRDFKVDYDLPENIAAVTLFNTKKNRVGMFIIAKPFSKESIASQHAIIAHEACHMTWATEDKLGNLFSNECQEVQAYMIQYFVQEIVKWLSK